ncbi:MAG: hypothetical protein QNJ44_24610 [Rhodobacter sp.]|nr:hypothetical protein [Rhodobacter sp.]
MADIATLVLAAVELRKALKRPEVKAAIEALKAKLSKADSSARLTLPSGASVDLARTSTDAAIDLIIAERGGTG